MAGYNDGYGQQRQMQFAFPPFTGWVRKLIMANAAVFLVVLLLGFAPGVQNSVVDFLGLNPGMWASYIPAIWQPVTYAFLHSPDNLGHVLWNMLYLYFFGRMVEGAVGGSRFIFFYITAAVVAGLVQLGLGLALGQHAVTIGASGAALAVLVAAATLQPHSQVILIFIPVKLWVLAAILVAMDVFPLIRELQGAQSDHVAHLVHVVGAAYGFAMVRKRWIWKDPLAEWERRKAESVQKKRVDDDARMDAILAKISREGVGSLSRSEKAFLNQRSAGK